MEYYENECQKTKSGKVFSFSILTNKKNFFQTFQTGK